MWEVGSALRLLITSTATQVRSCYVANVLPRKRLIQRCQCVDQHIVRMGRKNWRLQEERFLDGLVNSDEGQRRFARAIGEDNDMWWKNTVDWLVREYKMQFNHCFDEETTEEFATRQKMQPRAKLAPFPAETEEDLQMRMSKVTSVSSSIYLCSNLC